MTRQEQEGHQHSVEYYLDLTQEELDDMINQVETKLAEDMWWEAFTPLKGWQKTKEFMKRLKK